MIKTLAIKDESFRFLHAEGDDIGIEDEVAHAALGAGGDVGIGIKGVRRVPTLERHAAVLGCDRRIKRNRLGLDGVGIGVLGGVREVAEHVSDRVSDGGIDDGEGFVRLDIAAVIIPSAGVAVRVGMAGIKPTAMLSPCGMAREMGASSVTKITS